MEAEKNIWLKIAYDGSDFCGWQRQPKSRTVCGELENLLSSICKCPVQLNGTSRTDAKVHALGQCASFKAPLSIPVERLPRVLNDRLASVGDISILEAREMPEDFHARFCSKGKRYLYKIYNSSNKDIFLRNRCYQISRNLDINAMKKASQLFCGEHDFKAFMSSGSTPQESTVRTIYNFFIDEKPFLEGKLITFTVEGNAFLYNMVRILTGTLVEVGLGKISQNQIKEALEKGQRNLAGHVAPPQGLYLAQVFYDMQYFPQ